VEERLLQDLMDYFSADYDEEQETTLLFCIRRAINAFKNKRNYPDSYTDSIIEKDLCKYYPCIFDLALYWANKQGYEFETSHSENGVNISFQNENEIFALHSVLPIARFV